MTYHDLSIFLCGAALDLSADELARVRALLDEMMAERVKAEGRGVPTFGRPASEVGDVAQQVDEGEGE